MSERERVIDQSPIESEDSVVGENFLLMVGKLVRDNLLCPRGNDDPFGCAFIKDDGTPEPFAVCRWFPRSLLKTLLQVLGLLFHLDRLFFVKFSIPTKFLPFSERLANQVPGRIC